MSDLQLRNNEEDIVVLICKEFNYDNFFHKLENLFYIETTIVGT